ncbi:nuclear transport factor 2 family protein [Actinokineospora inagensis]|uniref:nuclear transport factor 2 family protein n=1 Tax=Actinokineospora inagensis TaxID=103730 RepID=UPI0004181B9A|nr:nuclear transport factor 2 family protein [Actinokineospora inagensis]
MPTPAEVIRAVVDGVCRLLAGDLDDQQREAQLDALAELYAEETDVQHPFAPLGAPRLRTRAELRTHFANGVAQRRAERYEAVGEVRQTEDPELVVFEFHYTGTVNGRDFSVPCVFVTRVRDGVIVESRDYLDHLAMARAFGAYDKVVAALAEAS